jgi:hypothetical protein
VAVATLDSFLVTTTPTSLRQPASFASAARAAAFVAATLRDAAVADVAGAAAARGCAATLRSATGPEFELEVGGLQIRCEGGGVLLASKQSGGEGFNLTREA